jgi:hypothetical protein
VAGLLALPTPAHAKAAGARVQFWATRSGAETLDGPNGSGNPFATALIEEMGKPDLSFPEVCMAVRARTGELSGGFMTPEMPGLESAPAWRFAPSRRERRVALVVVFSNYTAAPQLPGAATDGARMRDAFARAGFQTQLLVDPTRETLAATLADFSRQSARADVAALYSTGHGVEVGGVQYVLYADHVAANGAPELVRAARWADLAAAPRARKLNLTLWAGCRNNPYA